MRIRETPSGRLTADKVRPVPVFKNVFVHFFVDMGHIQANIYGVIDAVFDEALVPLEANRDRFAESSRAPLVRETLGDTDLASIAKRVEKPRGLTA